MEDNDITVKVTSECNECQNEDVKTLIKNEVQGVLKEVVHSAINESIGQYGDKLDELLSNPLLQRVMRAVKTTIDQQDPQLVNDLKAFIQHQLNLKTDLTSGR